MFFVNKTALRFALGAVVMFALGGAVQAASISIFNTGVDSAGAVVPNGTVGDLHYSLISAPGGVTPIKAATSAEGYPIAPDGPWIGDNTLSRWIGPNTGDLVGPAGAYDYRTTFDLTGMDPLTAVLTGRWATDDPGTDIKINGVSTGLTSAGFTSFSSFSINSGFIAGVNTLDFMVFNGGGPTGLRVEITGNAAVVPEPASLAILGLGLFGLGFSRRKKAK